MDTFNIITPILKVLIHLQNNFGLYFIYANVFLFGCLWEDNIKADHILLNAKWIILLYTAHICSFN